MEGFTKLVLSVKIGSNYLSQIINSTRNDIVKFKLVKYGMVKTVAITNNIMNSELVVTGIGL